MRLFLFIFPLVFLAACQSPPALEDDPRYTRLARVVDVHIYSDAERRESEKSTPHHGPNVGFSLGMGSGGFGFAGISIGGGGNSTPQAPTPAEGANRYTVQPVDTSDRLEVHSLRTYKVGDCVKLFSGHPRKYARLFDIRPEEKCK